MKSSPNYLEGAILALVLSVMASLLFSFMSSLLSGGLVFQVLITMISAFYLFYLLARTQEKVGRITVLSAWLLMAVLNHMLSDSALLFITIHISTLWLIRSLYFYSSLISSFIDLLVTFAAFVISILTWSHTGSLLLSIWCFFLIQSLFTFIPRQIFRQSESNSPPVIANENFEQAYSNAKNALEKINTHHSSNRRYHHE